MKCPSCGHENLESAVRCTDCCVPLHSSFDDRTMDGPADASNPGATQPLRAESETNVSSMVRTPSGHSPSQSRGSGGPGPRSRVLEPGDELGPRFLISLLQRFRMMEIRIASELKAKCPKAALGCVEAEVETGATPPGLDEALRSCEERIAKLPEPRAVLEASSIVATRAGYKALGKDPARYRGSAEALLRRLISGKGVPRINNVVDVINLVSLESRLPIGLYDLAHVAGSIQFRAGRAGETYKGIGKYDLNLEGLPLFADAQGPHGSATSDSERTMVTEATKRVLAIIVSFGGVAPISDAMKRLADLLTSYVDGREIDCRIAS